MKTEGGEKASSATTEDQACLLAHVLCRGIPLYDIPLSGGKPVITAEMTLFKVLK